ncbi:MAG: GTP pyrophosphokinase family protein [Lachnospiraceae bacterium]|nr:GTP pyrophosphokinase family protein [Lachnospiraceae bacterium]
MEIYESIYGDKLDTLTGEMNVVLGLIAQIREDMAAELGMDPIEHVEGRIKSEESIREKCRRKGVPETTEAVLNEIYDAIGIRIVCAFLDDVYTIENRIKALPGFETFEEKDYIRHVKPNGYRSLHLIIKTPSGFFAEIQLRTISMDTWAALEHHMRYKKEITGNKALIESELKRCADELASTDVSMQTIRDMINSSETSC